MAISGSDKLQNMEGKLTLKDEVAQLEGLAIGLEQRGEKSAAHIIRLAIKRMTGKIALDELTYITGIRPWVNGDAFIGPSIQDLLLGYYTSQGERGRAQEFADNHLQALRDKL
jgi:hypothetical protein